MMALWMRAYLVAWLFWLTVALGCWGWELVHNLTGGNWGRPLRPLFGAGTATLPWLVIGFLVLIPELAELYPWVRDSGTAADPRWQHKQSYLNVPCFVSRAAAYFVLWIGSVWCVRRAERQVLETGSPAAAARLNGFSGVSLVLYFWTISFAAIDWCMSLEPHFTSVAYGVVFLISLSLAGLACAIAAETVLEGSRAEDTLNDQGNLLLTFVMLWAYASFCQFLIVWYSNLPEESVWYSRRFQGGWQAAAVALVGLNFALPFALLLSRHVKRSPRLLGPIAAGLLAMHWVEIVWLVEPAHEGAVIWGIWRDFLVTAAIGVPWVATFRRRLELSNSG